VGRLRDRKRPPSWDAKRSRENQGRLKLCQQKKHSFFREIHGNPLLFKSKKTGEMLKMLGFVISWMDGRCLDVG